MSFKDKVVIVTGGSSGIGAKTAILFAKEGAQVTIVGRNTTKLENVSAECERVGLKPLTIVADLTKDEEAKTIVEKTVNQFGKLDILVNNAGASSPMNGIQDPDLIATFDRLIPLNLRSVFLLSQLAMPELKKTKGNIVNVSSIFGLSPVTQTLVYATSKAGLSHFTKCLALEVAQYGVRVNSVNPGPTETDFIENLGIGEEMSRKAWEDMGKCTPIKGVTQPEEVADLIAFLASDKAISCTGGIYPMDRGTMLVGCEVLNGASSKTAILFAKEGAQVTIVGRNTTKLENVSAECERVGLKPLTIVADLTKDEEAKTIVEKTVNQFGKLDILVNNAGASSPMNGIQDPDLIATFDRLIPLNLRSVFLLSQLAMPELKKTKGNIVNVSSIFGLSPVTQTLVYATSKAGLSHFTKCLALEVAQYGVRVNSVNPGPTETDFIENLGIGEEMSRKAWEDMGKCTPIKGVTQPEEVADLIAFLASDKAISCTGGIYPMDRGTMLVGCEVLNGGRSGCNI